MSDDLEAAVDALYAGDPDEFVAARDRLARELTKAGDKEGSARVKKLRRPSVAAAALNQLTRSDPDAVADLLKLGERLTAAQQKAVTGGGSDTLRELTTERRKAVGRLASSAARGLTTSARDAVAATLEAATVDPTVGELLRSGRLTSEASTAGFGLDLFALAETTEVRRPERKAAERPRPSRLTVAPDPEEKPRRKAAVAGKPAPNQATAAPKDAPAAPSGHERAARQAGEDAAKKRALADADEQAVREAKAEVAARERALKEAKKALTDAQRKAQRSELAAATAEHKAWELGERLRDDG